MWKREREKEEEEEEEEEEETKDDEAAMHHKRVDQMFSNFTENTIMGHVHLRLH